MEITRTKNVAAYVVIPMVDKDSPESFKTGETVTDTAYYKDGAGAWTSLAITDTFTEIGSTGLYECDLTAAEMNHDQIIIKLTATNSQDNSIVVSLIPAPANMKQIEEDDLSGNNATLSLKQLDIDNNAGDAISAVSSGSNGNGMTITGHGTGHGIDAGSGSGATGNGITATSNATSGSGVSLVGVASGMSIDGTTYGLFIRGTGGSGIYSYSSGSNGYGALIEGHGTSAGVKVTGGSTSGHGVDILGSGVGHGLFVRSGTGGAADGIRCQSQSSGSLGHGLRAISSNGNGIYAGGTNTGMHVENTSSGRGMLIEGAGSVEGLRVEGGAFGDAVSFVASSSMAALKLSGGANGLEASGTTAGINAAGVTNGDAILATGAGTGNGIEATGTNGARFEGTEIGFKATASAGNGAEFESSGGNGDGFAIIGNGSGSGMDIDAGETGAGISCTAAGGVGAAFSSLGGNEAGLYCSGSGTGHGMQVVAGATGNGLDISAGGSLYAIALDNSDSEDILEQIHSATAGRMQLQNSTPATATQIEMTLYKYDKSTSTVVRDIKEPDGTANETQLDAAAMAGRA